MSSITPSIPLTPDPTRVEDEISRSLWSDAWTRLRRRPSTLICLAILAIYLLIGLASFIPALKAKAESAVGDDYLPPTLTSFDKLLGARDAKYPAIVRVSDPGPASNRAYTGFFFYQVEQVDVSGRYVLGLKVYCQSRDVRADDRGDVGFFDLKDNF